GVPAHRHQARRALQLDDRPGVREPVRKRYFHLHVLAGAQAGERLARMDRRRGREDDRIDIVPREALGEIGGDVADAVLLGHPAGRLQGAPDQGHDLDAVDVADRVQMLGAEGSRSGKTDFDGHGWSPAARGAPSFSRMMWPTAVFDAGTW